MLTEILVATELISASLAVIIIFIFFKAYLSRRAVFLLGLPIGFSFLAISYVFLGLFLLYSDVVILSEGFLGLRLVTQSFGFAFIAFSYYFSAKPSSGRTAKNFLSVISAASIVSIFLIFGALFLMPPYLDFPSIKTIDEVFRVVNLIFLSYIIYYLFKKFESLQVGISGLLWAPLAFSILWLSQFSLLIWGIDGSQSAFAAAHIARFAALILFLRIYCCSAREGE
jgi:hypothetical protein